MLRRLDIRNFVIVDHLGLEFAAGFGALTGETGAGKSILIDALALALGARADATVVRTGAPRAEISAEFDLAHQPAARQWLAEHDFPAEEGVCLMRRIIDAGGRSRAYLNGSTATLSQLCEAGGFFADIHGQHAHHALLRSEAQRDLLDAQAGQLESAREVAALWRAWRVAADERAALERDRDAINRERDMLEWQAGELRELDFELEGWHALNHEHKRLTHAASLLEGVGAAFCAVTESDDAATSVVERVAAKIGTLKDVDPGLNEAFELLQAAAISLEEAGSALRHYQDRLEVDPARLGEIEARIEAVMQLARKHRVSPEALPGLQQDIESRLAQLRLGADPEALARREAAAHEAYFNRARQLSTARRDTAAALAAVVTASMQDLALKGATFDIALEPLAEGGAHGLESVEFRVAANPNQPLRPLAKVASGGELSRIGLSIQVIASRAARTPTLIFDEVDVGIGGGVAEIVGRLLKQLGAGHQVMCVTHLPQVAAQADWQWSISKSSRDGVVTSRVTPLDDAARVEEIARMLGGVNITATTRSHAAELLGFAPSV